MPTYADYEDQKPVTLEQLRSGLGTLEDKPVAPIAKPSSGVIFLDDEPPVTPGMLEEKSVTAAYDEQATAFAPKPTPEQVEGMKEPEPELASSHATPSLWDRGEVGRRLAENKDNPPAGDDVFSWMMRNSNPYEPKPRDEAADVAEAKPPVPKDVTTVSRVLDETNPFKPKPVGEQLAKTPGLLDKAKKKVEDGLRWAGSAERFADIKAKYENGPKDLDAAESVKMIMEEGLDNVASGIMDVAGKVEALGDLAVSGAGFTMSVLSGMSEAAWKYVKNVNEDKWKLDADQLYDAAAHGGKVAEQLMGLTTIQPGTEAGVHNLEQLMYPFTEAERGIVAYGTEKGWSQNKIEAARFGFLSAIVVAPLMKAPIKAGGRTASRFVDGIKAKMGKKPLTQAEVDFYMENYKSVTGIDALDKLNAQQTEMRNVLRGYKDQLGIEKLQAYKDGTLGPGVKPFKDINSRLQQRKGKPTTLSNMFDNADVTGDFYNKAFTALKDGKDTISGVKDPLLTRHKEAFERGDIKSAADLKAAEEASAQRGEAAATVEATKEAPTNAVDHILNNKGAVAEHAAAKAAKTTDPVKRAELEKRAGEYAGMTIEEFEKKLEEDIGVSEAVSPKHAERLAKLKAIHAEYELKQAKAVQELDTTIAEEFESPAVTAMRADFDMDFYAQNNRLPTEAEFQTFVNKSQEGVTPKPEVVGLDSRVQQHPLFQDAELTKERADVYNDPNVAKSVSGNPLVASHKLINDINQYLHGEKRIDIDGIRNVLLKMQDRAHEFKNYFISDADFESFRSGIDEAVEFAELARNPEAVPQRSIKDLGKDSDGVTLSAGFDLTLLKSAVQDAIELSKKLSGKLAPSVMRERINQLGKTREMDVTGINAFLDQAEKEGRKVTREEVLENMSGMKLEMEVNRTSYLNTGRSFPNNTGYENHIYKWGVEDTLFNEAPGHYASHGSNIIFTTRVSREFEYPEGLAANERFPTKAYVLEELQSDWWQNEHRRSATEEGKALNELPLPFRESWGKNAVGFEMIQAIGEGANEFRTSTAETVLRAEGVMNANQTIEGVLKDPGSSEYRKSTINALVDTYDRGVPKAIRQFFAKWGEKAEIERVEKSSSNLNPTVFMDGIALPDIWDANGVAIPVSNMSARQLAAVEIITGHGNGDVMAAYTHAKEYFPSKGPKYVKALEIIKSIADREMGIQWSEPISTPSYYSVKIPPSLATKVKGAEVHTVKLNMGFDPSELGKHLEGTSKQMSAWFDKIRKQKNTPTTQRMEELTAKFMSDWIDIRSYSKKMLDQLNTKEGYEAYKRLVLISGAQTEAGMRIKQARNLIYKGLNRAKRDITDQIIFARRIIAIDKARLEEFERTGKHRPVKHPMLSKEEARALGFDQPVEFTADVAKRYLEDLERTLEPKDFADMIKRSSLYFNTMKDALTLLKDRGLITPQLYGRLIKWDYAKRQDIMEKLDPQGEFLIGREPITVRESGVKTLREGTNEDLLEIDSELMLADIIQAAYGRVFRNDANVALREIAVMTPDNGIVRIPKRPDAATPRGWSKVELFVDGKKEVLHLENDFARSWLLRNREVSFEIARRNQVLSGTAILKPMATGVNPEFAFANIVRDLAHIWLTSQVKVGDRWMSPYSKHLPLAIPQMAGDLAIIAKDTFLRKGRWLDAVHDGMGMQFLAHEGRVWRKDETTRSALDTIQEIVGYVNESSEILSRLMVRERAMRNYAKRNGLDWEAFKKANVALRREWKDGRMVEKPEAKNIDPAMRKLVGEIRREGSFIGRDYMDFSSHGSKGEYTDTIVPYLNPGIQGTRGLFRAAKRNPAEFATKLAWVAGTTFSLYMANRMNNQEGYDKVSKQAKLNNWIIMTNTKIKDANGVERYVYYTIPKDPSQRYFTYMLDTFTQKFLFGEDVDIPGVMETAASLFPVGPENVLGVTPTGNAILAAFNIDAWRTMLNKSVVSVWKTEELPDDQQGEGYIEGRGMQDTPEWAKTLGKALNVKPVLVEQMLGSYFTHTGNLWTWMSGKAFDEVFGDEANNARQDLLVDAMSQYEKQNQLPLFRRFIGLTTSDSDKDIDITEDIHKEFALKNLKVDRQLDWIASGVALGEYDMVDLIQFRVENPDYKEKINEEIEALKTLMNPDIVDPNNRAFWYSMRKPMKNEERAQVYYERYSRAPSEKQNELEAERIILGYNTSDFKKEFYRILANSE